MRSTLSASTIACSAWAIVIAVGGGGRAGGDERAAGRGARRRASGREAATGGDGRVAGHAANDGRDALAGGMGHVSRLRRDPSYAGLATASSMSDRTRPHPDPPGHAGRHAATLWDHGPDQPTRTCQEATDGTRPDEPMRPGAATC